MALKTHEHSLGGCYAARTCKAICEGDLGGGVRIGRGLLAVEDDLSLEGLRLRGRGGGEGLDGFDARDTGGDEVVEVVGGENGTHGAGC